MSLISDYGLPVLITTYGWTLLSAAVSALPVPNDESHSFYKWFYKFGNTVMANVTAIRGKALYEEKKPSTPTSE